MKNKMLAITFLLLAAFVAGCTKEETASQQVDRIKSETKEAAQDLSNYTYAQKGEFTEKMQNRLAEIGRDLDQLAAKIEKSSDAIKAEAKPKLQELRNQATQLNRQLDEVRNATESTWDSVKASTRKTYDALADGFQQARQWVSDKIAP